MFNMAALTATFLGAGAWSVVFLLVLTVAGRLAGWRSYVRDLPVLAALIFFLVLTQYPLPDRATLVCPVPLADPDFLPGNSITHVRAQIDAWGWRVAFFKDRTVIAAAMNLLFCVAIGLGLVWQGRFGWRAVLAFALALPLLVETTQITGTWGIFPCAYRKFDMDDIIVNFAGVVLGYWLGRRGGWMRRGAV